MDKDDGRVPQAEPGCEASPSAAVPASSQESHPSRGWLELRPDEKGRFDELVATFADGLLHIETLDKDAVYLDLAWDDGRYCQLWIGVSGKRLTYYHEDGVLDPPRFTAAGIDTWASDRDRSANAARPEGQEPDGEAGSPNPRHDGDTNDG